MDTAHEGAIGITAMPIGRSTLRFIGAALAVVALTAFPEHALAHANLVRSDPGANASLDKAPAQVELWFSERPEPKLTEIQVFDQQRRRVDAGLPTLAPDDAQALIEQLRPGLSQGIYTVSWRATSAVDGHITGGAFAFGLGVAPPSAGFRVAAPAPAQTGPTVLSAIIRWAGYLAADGLLGLVLFGWFVLEPKPAGAPGGLLLERFSHRIEGVSRVLVALLVLSACGMLADQAAQSGGSYLAVLGTQLGAILAMRLVLAVLVLILADGISRGIEAARPGIVAALLAMLFLMSLTSHALTVPGTPELALFVDWLHISLAGVWLGGLLALALCLLPAFRERAGNPHPNRFPGREETGNSHHDPFADGEGTVVRAGADGAARMAIGVGVSANALGPARAPARLEPNPAGDGGAVGVPATDIQRKELFANSMAAFSRVALISAGGLALTGLYQALAHVGSVDNAFSTSYGLTVVAKTALFGIALLVAGYNRWWLLPALRRPSKAGATRARRFFSRTIPLEALLVVLVLGATGVLMTLAPANAQEGGATAQTKTLGDTKVTLQVLPKRVGPNLFQVDLKSKGRPVTNADKVELRLTMLDMDMGQSVLDLQSKGNGSYAAESDALAMSGRWQIDLLLRLPGQFDQRATFEIQVPA